MRNKILLAMLALLAAIKYGLYPWLDWSEEMQGQLAMSAMLLEKQRAAIEAKDEKTTEYDKLSAQLSEFTASLPAIGTDSNPNSLWFKSIDKLKKPELKIYSQQVEYDKAIGSSLGIVVGRLAITGEPVTLMQTLFELESMGPSVILESLDISKGAGSNRDKLIAQVSVAYWFRRQ